MDKKTFPGQFDTKCTTIFQHNSATQLRKTLKKYIVRKTYLFRNVLVKYLANVDFPMSFPPQIRITGALAVKHKTKTDNY